jgi:polyisoprenoid-binding protein YceI
MKLKFVSILGLTSAMFLASCNGGTTENTGGSDTTKTDSLVSGTFNADTASSLVNWSGGTAGATVYGHSGTLKLASGSLEVVDGKLSAGTFTIDMKSLTPTDSAYEFNEKSNPAALKGHLSAAEFFAIDSFPTAQFVVKSVDGNNLVGELTIKGKTNPETIAVENLQITATEVTANGKLTINRQKYGVAWKHFLKDTVLSDELPLTITLVAKK